MDVSTISMDQGAAQRQLAQYRRELRARQRNEKREVAERIRAEDAAVEEMLHELAQGRLILDLHESLRLAGCDPVTHFPKLAIARADQQRVVLSRHGTDWVFGPNSRGQTHQKRLYTRVPASALPGISLGQGRYQLQAVVPTIPPHLRPSRPLENYHILWEAEWVRVPVDPILLRRIRGHHYVVLAQWDLTEVERAVLSARLNERG